jgi:hypothetical protein
MAMTIGGRLNGQSLEVSLVRRPGKGADRFLGSARQGAVRHLIFQRSGDAGNSIF